MNSRERVLQALNHKEPDRVPTFFRRHTIRGRELSDEQMKFINKIIDIGPYLNMKDPLPRVLHTAPGKVEYDELGIGRRYTGLYWDIVEFPLAHMKSAEELDEYPWPEIIDKNRVSHLRKESLEILAQGKAVAVMGSWGGSTGIFELSRYMRGLENFLIDLMVNEPFAVALLNKQLEMHKKRWKLILEEVGDIVDIVCTGDDLAMQTGILIPPDKYRMLIKPRQKELIDYIKKYTGAKIYYHSCGAIEPFITDLIEIGVDILDPIQPASLNTERLKDKYGRQLSFFGGVDVQNVLPYGSTEDVRNEVFTRFAHMGKCGGLILGPSHWLQVDTPWENIQAMYEAILECKQG